MKSFNGTLKKLMLGTSLLGASVLGGCLMTDGGAKSSDVGPSANLVISVGVKDVNKLTKAGLGKSAALAPDSISLKKLVVTLTSSIESDSVIRDTLVASDTAGSAFTTSSTSTQQVLKQYAVKPLRDWTIQVKTLDANDSAIHIASDTVTGVEVGENVPVVLNLTSRFVVYVAKFLLPDSIGSSDTNVTLKQKVNINRLVMVVDGDTVVNQFSDSGTYFEPEPIANYITWPYVTADTTHTVGLYVYTDSLNNWDPKLPLYGNEIEITSTDSTYTPSLPWTGPGSPSDPNYDPENPGGAQADLTINIGPVEMVEINTSIPKNPLPRR